MKKTFRTFYILILFILTPLTLNAQWVQTSGPPYITYSLIFLGTNIFAGTSGGVYLTTNYGTNWIAKSNGLNQSVSSLAVSGANIFAGTSGGVYLTTNNGTSWAEVNNGLPITGVTSLAVSGANIFAGTNYYRGVFLSTNNGTNWTSVGITNYYAIWSLAISGEKIFAGTSNGDVYLSTNNGTNWTSVNIGTYDVYALAVSGTNLFAAGAPAGVLLSTNNGTNWTVVNNGLTNHWVRTLAFSGTNLFAGTINPNGGVFLSTNNGTTWFNRNQGFTGNQEVYAFTITNNYIFAGTFIPHVWRRSLPEILITEIPIVRLTYPANNATYVSLTTQLDWADTINALKYQLQVSPDSGFVNIVWDTTVVPSNAIVPNGKLTYSTKYFWKVRGINGSIYGPYSSTWNFTTPIIPTVRLKSPANGIINAALTPQFDWADTNYIEKYQIQVSLNPSFTTTVWDTIVYTSYALIPNGKLSYSTMYYWRVRGINGTMNGQYSTIWSFTTGNTSPPSVAPTLINPANNSTENVLIPIFNWNSVSGASSYRCKVASDSLFTEASLKIDTTISGTSATISLGRLLYFSKYFWRVYGANQGGYGPSSTVWNFTTLLPPAPTLLSPSNDTLLHNSNIMFSWSPIQYISGYRIRIARDINFTNIYSDSSILNNFLTIYLPFAEFYFWKVCAKGNQGDGPWSNIRLFSMFNGIHQISQVIPDRIKMHNNYPNPFNPTTIIRYDLSKNDFVKLVVFDILGREVASLVNEKQSAGVYEVNWDASVYPSGVYFYRLVTDGFTDTKKMILLK
jgi:hypothetical protein